MFKKMFLLLTMIFLFISCQNRPLQQLGATSISQKIDEYELEGGGNVTVDILFVIDNSGSMAEEQEKVAQNIGKFMKMLQVSAAAGKTDYQIGVITSSIYDQVQSPGKVDIEDNEDGRLLEFTNGKRYLTSTEHNETVVQLLENRIRTIGVNGSGIERGFDAIERALGERVNAENAGFLRDEAKLMIIVIGDEDDCSTGLRPVGSNDAPFPITRGRDCVEQYYQIPEAIGIAETNLEQNKVKPVSYYYDFLLGLKKGNPLKIGFATIVGPLNCWTGEINDMGQGPQGPLVNGSLAPFPLLNCSYHEFHKTHLDQTLYDSNFDTCQNNVTPTCSCIEGDESIPSCLTGTEFFVSCYNDAAGIPNKIPIISTESCSKTFLHGKCDDGYHCAVTESGVKCEENTCSISNLTGTCPANQTCNNAGECVDKIPTAYALRDSKASPGARFLELQKMVEAGNPGSSYKYAICLEDFGTPLSLIGAELASAECEYRLINKTDAPCTVAINIFAPEDEKLENGTQTNLDSPWIYTTLEDCSGLTGELNEICEANKTRTFAEKGEALVQICKDNIDKPYSERIDVSKFLEKANCGKDEDGDGVGDGPAECLFITFPEENNACPQPGSNVQIYYGVNE